MVQITQKQWSGLAQARLDDFMSRARVRLRQIDPGRFPLLDEAAQRGEIRAGVDMGKRLGIVSERGMILFLEVRCFFASAKNLRPEDKEWASNLFSCGGCDPERTVEYLHEVVSKKIAAGGGHDDEREEGHA